jgi:NAD+ diphosphatase
VSAPRYLAAQPWPFPASLMLGYEASARRTALDGEPVPQEGEMVEVRWFSLEQVREAARAGDDVSDAGAGLRLPGEVSIARTLIDAWVARGGRRLDGRDPVT